MRTDIEKVLKGFETIYPIKIDYVPMTEGSTSGKDFPYICPAFQNNNSIGLPTFIQHKESECICTKCNYYSDCPIVSAYLTPVYVGGYCIGTIVIQPQSANDVSWMQGHRQQLKEWVPSLTTLLASQESYVDIKQENQQLKQELRGFLSMSKEAWVVLNLQGMIMEVSLSMCTLVNRKPQHLSGENITTLIPDQQWKKIQLTSVFDTIQCYIKETTDKKKNEKRSPWNVHIKVIYEQDQKQSILLKFDPSSPDQQENGERRVLYSFEDIKGTSEPIQSIKEIAERVSTADTTILLRGESGTGKEVFAQAIHQKSTRFDQPFVAINCAAIPESLLESELFGYESGAFTGARSKGKIGRFELANKGTIFLDEIGDMSLNLQSKLLRIVQERKFERVGGTKSIDVDVRIIAATHRNLEKLVAENEFREDLYYRLNVIPLTIPPLRERKDDIPILIESFMKSLSKQVMHSPKRLSKEVWKILFNYHWPGNIRELRNVIEHVVQLEIGDLVTEHSLPTHLRVGTFGKELKGQHAVIQKRNHREEEKEKIMEYLDIYGRHTEGKKVIAKKLGISLPTLYRRMKKYKVD